MQDTLTRPKLNIFNGIEMGTMNLSPQLSGTNIRIFQGSFVGEELRSHYESALSEWTSLVGKEKFFSLSLTEQRLLINTAGIFDFKQDINIYESYKYSIY
ncbi:hypothetical protein KJA15_02080 [Patescibacteria group bacterium]|nr:hypothetical protein [Patescibacteria group bacterium]